MGSPSMDRYAGYQQARLDMMRGDMFALINHRQLVLDWNQDKASWTEGYAEFLLDVSENTDGTYSPREIKDALFALDKSTQPPLRNTLAA